METNSVNCFVCYASCVTKDAHLGSHIEHLLTMPLSTVLSKCLQSIVNPEDEYFCGDCSRKIEEYDQFVQICLQIETELYEHFQNRMSKIDNNTVENTVERVSINEILIQSDLKEEESDTEIHLESHDSQSERVEHDETESEKSGDNTQKYDLHNVPSKEKLKKTKKSTKKTTNPKPHYTIEQVFCDICGRSYMSKGALSVHITKHLKRSPHGNSISRVRVHIVFQVDLSIVYLLYFQNVLFAKKHSPNALDYFDTCPFIPAKRTIRYANV